MSALGQKQTHAVQQRMSALLSIATAKADFGNRPMSALHPKADICSALAHVGFGPRADIATQLPIGLVSVNFDNCLPRRSSRSLIVGGQYRAELSGIFAASRRSHGTHLLQWNSTLGNRHTPLAFLERPCRQVKGSG